MKIREFAVMLVVMLGMAVGAQAANVVFTAEMTSANTFDLWAEVTGGAGLAGYNIEIDNVASFEHIAPKGVPISFVPQGFTLGNNASTVTGPTTGTNAIFSGQNTSGGTGALLYNVGILPGTAAAQGWLPGSETVADWGVPVLIGHGTTNSPAIFLSASANVFDDQGGVTASQAQVETQTLDIPEPATMALLGLGGLALLRRRRSA